MIAILRLPAAERDLEDIWLSIAADSPPAAKRTLQAIATNIERLADHPRMGPRRPDIRPAARVLVEGRYLGLYETHPDTDDGQVDVFEIVRDVDARRDLAILF